MAPELMKAMDTLPSCPIATDWLCVGRRRWRLPRPVCQLLVCLSGGLQRLLGSRLVTDRWIRYRVCLEHYRVNLATVPPPPSDVELSRIDETIISRLREHPSRHRNQLQSAFRFWEHGLRHGYIWLQDNEPLCFMWLFLAEDNHLLHSLPQWGGMYPPLPQGWGQLENIFTFGRGMRRPGGAATDFAHAVIFRTKTQRLKGLITHMHENNLMARRWAERTGCKAYGTITRYRLDLPLLRALPWFVHHTGEVPQLTGAKQPCHPHLPGLEAVPEASPCKHSEPTP